MAKLTKKKTAELLESAEYVAELWVALLDAGAISVRFGDTEAADDFAYFHQHMSALDAFFAERREELAAEMEPLRIAIAQRLNEQSSH